MNEFESVIIINPGLDESKIDEIIENVNNKISENGKVKNIDKIGMKKLAYEVKGNKEGYFVLFYFKGELSIRNELEQLYKNTNEIIKFIIIKRWD